MKKGTITKALKSFKIACAEHSGDILDGLVLAGHLSSVCMGIAATPEAVKRIEDKKKQLNKEKLKIIDVVKTAGPCYIPTIVMSGLTVAGMCVSNSNNAKRNAIMATMVSASESAFKEYRQKVVETIGEKKESEIREQIAQDHMETEIKRGMNRPSIPGHGSIIVHDAVTGATFMMDMDVLERGFSEAKDLVRDEGFISLTELYTRTSWDLPHSLCGAIMDEEGFDGVYSKVYMNKNFTGTFDGFPCLEIDYRDSITMRYLYERNR